MRERFNLDLTSLDSLCTLLYGAFGAGKTHLAGDFLKWAQTNFKGPTHYLNIVGEEGEKTLGHMGLGDIGERVGSLKDYHAALSDYAKEKSSAIVVDSLHKAHRLVLLDLMGEVRLPDAQKDGQRMQWYWGELNLRTQAMIARLRSAAPYTMMLCSHNKGTDLVTGGVASIEPGLYGRAARDVAGEFDAVMYLTAETLGPDRVDRKVTMSGSSTLVARVRLPPGALTRTITLPTGPGGWSVIYQALENAITKTKGDTPNNG